MTIETATAPADDFDASFASFAAPEDAGSTAAPVKDDAAGAAAGGTNGSGDAGAAAAGGEPGAAADAGAGDSGAGTGGGAQGDAPPAEGEKAPEAGSEAAGTGEGGNATTAAAPAAAAEPSSEPSPDDVLARLSKLVADAKPAEAAPAAETKAEEKPVFSQDEQAQLAAYDKDWPDVAKYEALKRRGEYQELLGFVFSEVQKVIGPLQQTLDALAGRTHLTDVKSAVPDYSDNLRQQVVDWVKTQPAYLQPAYDHVITQGTVEEVKDLVDRYRQATGQTAPAAGAAITGQSDQRPAKDNELSGAAKEAAAALAPVESKRSEVLTPGDPSNYDDAWSQFAKDLA